MVSNIDFILLLTEETSDSDEDAKYSDTEDDDGQDSDASGPSSRYLEDVPGGCSVTSKGVELSTDSASTENDPCIPNEYKHYIEDHEMRDSGKLISELGYKERSEDIQHETFDAIQREHLSSAKRICDTTFIINSPKVSLSLTQQRLSHIYKKPVSVVQPITSPSVKLSSDTCSSKGDRLTKKNTNGDHDQDVDLAHAVLLSLNRIALALSGINEGKQENYSQDTYSKCGSKLGASSWGTSSKGASSQGTSSMGAFSQGISSKSASSQGISSMGAFSVGTSPMGAFSQGLSSKGASSPGTSSMGSFSQGISSKGASSQGTSSMHAFSQGTSSKGASSQGTSSKGAFPHGTSSQSTSSRSTSLKAAPKEPMYHAGTEFNPTSQIGGRPKPTFQSLGKTCSTCPSSEDFYYQARETGFEEKTKGYVRCRPNTVLDNKRSEVLDLGKHQQLCSSEKKLHPSARRQSLKIVPPPSDRKSKSSSHSVQLENGYFDNLTAFSSPIKKRSATLCKISGSTADNGQGNNLEVCPLDKLITSPCFNARVTGHQSTPLAQRPQSHRRSSQILRVHDKDTVKVDSYSSVEDDRSFQEHRKQSRASVTNSDDNDWVFDIRKVDVTSVENDKISGKQLNCKMKFFEVSRSISSPANKGHLVPADRLVSSPGENRPNSKYRTAKSLNNWISSPREVSKSSVVLTSGLSCKSSPFGSYVRKRTARESVDMDIPDSLPTKHAKRGSPLSNHFEQCLENSSSSQPSRWQERSTPMKRRNTDSLRWEGPPGKNIKLLSPIRRTAPVTCGFVSDPVMSPCKGRGCCDKSFCFDCC